MLVDLPSAGLNRPAIIGGYIPDVFAIDAPETCRIIGEAKTALDCESERSYRQLQAFLSHLSLFPNGTLYLCVPWFYRRRAETLLAAATRVAGVSSVTYRVIWGF
jgi:hypothetical protein